MSKNKISEWSATAANNTDVGGIDIAEGCAPSGINNAIREMMAQVKDQQTGADGDNFTVGGNLTVTGTATLSTDLIANSSSGTSGQYLKSRGSGSSPEWATLTTFVSGMIMLWSGSSASIPSGWVLCDGNNSTPNLTNRFVVGAGNSYAVGATGGSADAVIVSHTHTASVTDPGHTHTYGGYAAFNAGSAIPAMRSDSGNTYLSTASNTTGISVSNSTTGVSGTNANLPPYYALCYIMKT